MVARGTEVKLKVVPVDRVVYEGATAVIEFGDCDRKCLHIIEQGGHLYVASGCELFEVVDFKVVR